jgi:hypothetical protein
MIVNGQQWSPNVGDLSEYCRKAVSICVTLKTFYDKLREHFTEPQIVELGLNVAMCVGVGRLSATWDMVEELPERFRADGEVTPWGADARRAEHWP